jgi:Protein of unknown function (DUF2985)
MGDNIVSDDAILVDSKNMKKQRITVANVIAVILVLGVLITGALIVVAALNWIRFSSDNDKRAWIEINSQILNAIFSAQAFWYQPRRALYVYWAYRYTRAYYARSKNMQEIIDVRYYAGKLATSLEVINLPLLVDYGSHQK